MTLSDLASLGSFVSGVAVAITYSMWSMTGGLPFARWRSWALSGLLSHHSIGAIGFVAKVLRDFPRRGVRRDNQGTWLAREPSLAMFTPGAERASMIVSTTTRNARKVSGIADEGQRDGDQQSPLQPRTHRGYPSERRLYQERASGDPNRFATLSHATITEVSRYVCIVTGQDARSQ